MLIEIKHRYTNKVLFACEAENMRAAVILALGKVADLRGADLRGTALTNADLRGIDLTGADLTGADLRYSNLRNADLTEADLTMVNLTRADLRYSNLTGANLTGANLTRTDLTRANLTGTDLQIFKTDFFDTLLRAPKEIDGLRNAIVEGRVNGSLYEGVCACLKGTIANIRKCHHEELGAGIVCDSSLPAEQWFAMIKEGDTPETNQASRLSVEWIDEFKLLLEAAK